MMELNMNTINVMDLSTIISKGSFRLKATVTSGETNQKKINKIRGKILGPGWNPSADTIYLDLIVTLKTANNEKILLSPESLLSIDTTLLTPRNLLSVVNGVYDPLGLVAPITIRLRAAFRDLFRSGSAIEWDTPLPPGPSQTLWLSLIQMLVCAGTITFHRNTKPRNAVGKSQLISFFDGSDVAFAATIYIRWTLADGSVQVSLLCAKTRVTPLQRISTPRSELNGAVIASRLLLSCIRSLLQSSIIPENVWFIGDSECTLASLEKIDAAFGEYFGNRVGEIIDSHAKIEQLINSSIQRVHIQSIDNAADKATRLDSTPIDLHLHSQ